MSRYAVKLKDGRWQQKRLEVMQRAGWVCESPSCPHASRTLNVHHGAYLPGLDPWEYPDELLWCLCEDCHRACQEALWEVHRLLGEVPPWLLLPGTSPDAELASVQRASAFLKTQLPIGEPRSRLALCAGAKISGIGLGSLGRARHLLGVVASDSGDENDPILWERPA